MNDLDYNPCENCTDNCDEWEMHFCCRLCEAYNANINCDNCNRYDIQRWNMVNELMEKALKDNDLLNNEEWEKIYYYALDNEIETLEDGTDYDTEFWFAIIFKHNDETYKFSYATDYAG